jgi:hypothetical protein
MGPRRILSKAAPPVLIAQLHAEQTIRAAFQFESRTSGLHGPITALRQRNESVLHCRPTKDAPAARPLYPGRSAGAVAGTLRRRSMMAGPVRTRPIIGGRAMDWRPVDGWAMHGRSVDRPMAKARVAPAMPTGRAAPAEPASPRKAALVPARAAPRRIVPAVPPAAPNELRLFHRRAFGKRGWRRKRANAKRGLGGKGELGDQSTCHGER